MKIICSGISNNTKILTDSGEDITQQMGITDIYIGLSVNSLPTIDIKCNLLDIDFEVAQENAVIELSGMYLSDDQATQLNKLVKSWIEPK